MATVTPDDLRAVDICNELQLVTDAQIVAGQFIEQAERRLDPLLFGTDWKLAVSLLAAHMVWDATGGATGKAAAGPVTSYRAGPVAESYAAPRAGSTDSLDSSSFGRRYKHISRSKIGGNMALYV